MTTTYQPPGSAAVGFDMVAGGYLPPAPLAVDFLLSAKRRATVPGILCSTGQVFARAGSQYELSTRMLFAGAVATRDASLTSMYKNGRVLADETAQAWDRLRVLDGTGHREQWGTPLPVASDEAQGYDAVPAKDSQGRHDWDDSIRPTDIDERQGYNVPPPRDAETRAAHCSSDLAYAPTAAERSRYIVRAGQVDFALDSLPPYSRPGALVLDFVLAAAGPIDYPTRPLAGIEGQGWRTPDPQSLLIRHPWDDLPRIGTEQDFTIITDPDPVDHEPPEQPEIRGGYVFVNSAQMLKMPEGTPVEFADLDVGLDIDSLSWSCTCTILSPASMSLLRPTEAGPVEVSLTITGHNWILMVESYSIDKRFAKETYRISAVSRTQMLTGPYAPARTRRITAPTNAAQICNDELEYTGFAVNWPMSVPDYTVPANAWGYEAKTAAEVIGELAAAAGAVLVPALDDDVLHVRPRYRVAPWSWSTMLEADIDAIIPDTLTMSYASQWSPRPLFDTVYLSGRSAGVAVAATRTGYPGTSPAADVLDDLNVDTMQCTERARAILSASGNQEMVTLEAPLPTSGAPGLVLPSEIVEWRDTLHGGAGTWRGLVLENRISVSKPGSARVIQRLQIERHHY